MTDKEYKKLIQEIKRKRDAYHERKRKQEEVRNTTININHAVKLNKPFKPLVGEIIYNITTYQFEVYDGENWLKVTSFTQ